MNVDLSKIEEYRNSLLSIKKDYLDNIDNLKVKLNDVKWDDIIYEEVVEKLNKHIINLNSLISNIDSLIVMLDKLIESLGDYRNSTFYLN